MFHMRYLFLLSGLMLAAGVTVAQTDPKSPPPAKPAAPQAQDQEPANLSEEELARIIQYLQNSPIQRNRTLGERLRVAREQDPAQLAQVLTARMARTFQDEIERRNANPELFDQRETQKQLQQDIFNLAKRIRESEVPAQAEKLTRDLQRLLDREYETRLAIRQLELADLEARIETLKEELERQKKTKDRFIADRLQRLTAVPDKPAPQSPGPVNQQGAGKNDVRNAVPAPTPRRP